MIFPCVKGNLALLVVFLVIKKWTEANGSQRVLLLGGTCLGQRGPPGLKLLLVAREPNSGGIQKYF